MSKPKRVEITWDDSFRHGQLEYWAEELNYDKAPLMLTIGYVVRQSKRFLTVAQTISPDGDFGGVFSIPAPSVHKVTKI